MLPGLRKPCNYPLRVTSTGRKPDELHGLWCCGGRGWVLRGDSDTEDGRLLLLGALYQGLMHTGKWWGNEDVSTVEDLVEAAEKAREQGVSA